MRKIQSEGNGRSIADYLSPKGSIVKDVIPLGLPGPKPSPAASYLQVTPMKPSQPRGCLSNQNTHPLPKRVPPLTSPGLNPVRAKPSPGPHPPQLPGVHHRASGGGGGDEAKDGKANLTNPITRKIQTSHSPVTSNPSRSITLDPRVGTGSGNSNVGSSSALFTAGLPLQSTPQYTAGDDRKDTMKNGCPLSHTMFSPVNPQQSGGSLDHRGTTQTSKLFTSGTKSLSQKRGRNPDLEERTKGEEMANKKLRPEDYRPNSSPAPICTSHPPYGTARLESCGTDLTKLKTASYRTITCTSSGKPSSPKDESVTMDDVASKLKTSPTFPAVRLFADESVKTEAGPRSPGIPSAGLESPMDEHANLNNEYSALKTIPLSASAKSASLCKDELFNMGTADFKASTRSPFLPSPTSRLDRKGKEGEKRKEGDQKSLSFLEEGEKRSKMDNPQKSLIFLEEDPLDVELGLGLDLGLELELSQASSSSSSEDELPSLQQILDRTARPPDTPEKGTFTAPSTPVGPRHHSQLPVTSKAKPTSYRNNLDEMLKEKESIQRSKEMETKLRLSCEENLLRLAEEEEEDESAENIEAAISHQQREFLQRFSVVSSAIRDLHPGEAMFSLDNFGRLFSQHTLQLRHCNVSPRDTAQKTLLWSTPDQFRSHVSSELIQRAYRSSPCPPQVARWLFQMVSVHSDKLTCHQVLKALKDIACSAAEHMMLNKNERFEVWVPSVGDVTLVFMNMGVPFVTLFPLENLQPQFTEGDLLEGFQISTESLSSKKELSTFPEHNFDSVIKYLSHCTSLCPRAYSDGELLLLLTVVSRVGLDTQLTLQPTEHLRSLLRNLISSIRDWDVMLPRICMSLIDLSDDHHNLRWLVQLLPDNIRGKQLRRHLSVSAISKLLNIRCTYRPSNTEFQLSDLRRYLPRMRPSSLLRGLATSFRRSQNAHREREEEEEDCASLDQQAYYLCYSLLALANEATNFEFFPPEQKNQLLLLCAELEKHIKCDIRESEKMLYRSKVKDFVARIYTKWQVLVQRTRPLQGKLYDYWQPLPEDAVSSSQESKHSHREREEEREDEETVMELEGEGVEGKGEDEKRIAENALSMEDERRETPEKYLAMEDEEGKVVKGEEEDKEERIAEKALAMEDEEGKVVKGEEEDKEERIAEKALTMEDERGETPEKYFAMEKEILGGEEKLLKMDELEEERMELTLEESGEERKMEDMEEKWTVVKTEERVTEKREAAAVEEERKGPTEGETEERGNLEKDSEMEEKGEE
ncbi:SMC5-SMC6 complex localization factor protein 2 isoform X7 [Oncorhynchus mykiss]|uniref:SMC5-SMC6 complex localization factor protein 2 isoform X7 n=1 Tax=Oncorhynchus mykiss TaxID=8022 RepID=UPI0018775858|nr:SMC5-SMC6 complex localization factor protein 2 isoform X7 [Oncorhynchus mykiss]